MPSYISPASSYVAVSWQRGWVLEGWNRLVVACAVEHHIKITQSAGHSISHYRIGRQLQALLTDQSVPRVQGCLDPKFHIFAMWKLQGEWRGRGRIMVFAVSYPWALLTQWNFYLSAIFVCIDFVWSWGMFSSLVSNIELQFIKEISDTHPPQW